MLIPTLCLVFVTIGSAQTGNAQSPTTTADTKAADYIPDVIAKISKTPAEWRKTLTASQFQILRQATTERAFANSFWNNHTDGLYVPLAASYFYHFLPSNAVFKKTSYPFFNASTKFDSGTGWPSFYQPIQKRVISERRDPDGDRVEILCARCDGHLGHLFDDANGQFGIPKTPNGLRYCMNSGAMRFRKKIADRPKP